jgi:hypothetical protein
VQEVVPFGPPIFEVLGDGAEVILVESDFHSLGLNLAERILRILHLVLLSLNLESVAILIVLVLEEFLENQVLIFLEDSAFAVNEGGKESQVFGREFAPPTAGSLCVEAFDEIVDLFFRDGGFDGLGVILEDAD